MKKLDRYIFVNFLKNFLIGLLAFLNIFILSQLFKVIGYIIDKKVTAVEGLELLLHGIPTVLIDVAPLGILLGGLMTINKMATNMEITAMKTSGISFRRIVMMPILFSAILSIFLLWFNDNVVPKSNEKVRLIKYDVVYNVQDSRIKTDVFMKGTGSYIFYIRLVNGKDQFIRDAEIIEFNEDMSEVLKIIIVKKGVYEIDPISKKAKWVFYKAKINDIVKNETYKFEKWDADFISESPNDFLRDKIRHKEMSLKSLKESITFIRKTGGDVSKLLAVFYKRTAYPFAAFVMCFIGLSLGSRYVRGGSAVSIGLSVVIGYSYYVVMAVLEAAVVGNKIGPLIGIWIPNILFLIIGLYSIDRAEF